MSSQNDKDADDISSERKEIDNLHGLLSSIYCYYNEDPREIRTYGYEDHIDTLTSRGELPINMILEFIFEYDKQRFKTEPVEWAIETIKNVCLVDKYGNNPLHIIARNINKKHSYELNNWAKDLINKGVSPYTKNKDGLTPLEIAKNVYDKFTSDDWGKMCESCWNEKFETPKDWFACEKCDLIIWQDNELQI